MEQQQVTLGYLFKHLKSKGIFVVEDLCTSHPIGKFWRYNRTNTLNTTLAILQNLSSGVDIVSDFMLPEEIKYLTENCESCIIEKSNRYERSEICFITKI